MAAKLSVLGLILSSYSYLRSAMVRFPLTKLRGFFSAKKQLKSYFVALQLRETVPSQTSDIGNVEVSSDMKLK